MNRYDMIYYVEANYCNPNGDPDMDNMPRRDRKSRLGLMTPQSLKRKIRDRLPRLRQALLNKEIQLHEKIRVEPPAEQKGYYIYIASSHNLKLQDQLAVALTGEQGKQMRREERLARLFYDVRAFGAVLTGGSGKKGADASGNTDNIQVVGPVQVSYGVSLDPINIIRVGLTCTVSRDEPLSNEVKQKFGVKDLDELQDEAMVREIQEYLIATASSRQRTMGRAYIVDHAIYKFQISVDPFLAEKMWFDEYDLALFIQTLVDWPNQQPTTSKFGMRHKKLFVFKHNSQYGNAPIWELERLIERNGDELILDHSKVPNGIEVIEL